MHTFSYAWSLPVETDGYHTIQSTVVKNRTYMQTSQLYNL